MVNKNTVFQTKEQLYMYMQLIKIVLGSVVAIGAFAFVPTNKFNFYIPYISAAMVMSGLAAIWVRNKFDHNTKWSPYLFTTIDLYAFLGCIYISGFVYNTIFFWTAGLIASIYFFTTFKFALSQAFTTGVFIIMWVESGLVKHDIIATDGSYSEAFIISTLANLIFVFSLFHYNEKLKRDFQDELIKVKGDVDKITTFPMMNPNPIFEYSIEEVLVPKNKVAREFILFAENEQLEDLIMLASSVLEVKKTNTKIIKLSDKDFQANAVFVEGRINLYLTDVTELLETKRVFQEREQYNRAILDAMPGFVSWIGKDRKYLGVNNHMCDFFGKKSDDFIGHTIGEISQGNNIISNLVEELFEYDKDVLQKEFSFEFNEKEYWSYITLKQYNEGENAVLVSTDITKLKEAQQQIREEQAKAESSAKLAAFGEMAAGIAHEINNPLAILNGIGYRLQKLKEKDKLTDEKFNDLITKLFYGVERIQKIITGMKNLSREGVNDEFEYAKIQDMLDDSLVLLAKKCSHSNIDLRLPEIPNNLGVVCQRVQISQALVILINNSIDAIESLDSKWIKIDVEEHEENIKISVSDSGLGITPEVAEKIFEPFYTTKGVGKGTGLGLSLANKIIKNHGGSFILDQECENTKFDMIFPKEISVKSAA